MKNLYIILSFAVTTLVPLGTTTAADIYNNKYPQNEWESRWNIDLAQCNSEAMSAYPNPPPVKEPPQGLSQGRTGTFQGYNSSGDSFYGTYDERPRNIFNTSPQDYMDYSDYQKTIMDLPELRRNYINSCLDIRGWKAR